jgi:hypothetical protein
MATGPKKKENRGGARKGAGRKGIGPSQKEVNAMKRAARKRAKEEGKGIDDVLLDIIYAKVDGISSTVGVRDRLAAIKIWKDCTIAKMQQKDVTVDDKREQGPVVLPERRPDPAKVVAIDGGKV